MKREPWQHEWSKEARSRSGGGGVVKPCKRPGCPWEMLSRKNSNRYRNGPDGAWVHNPKHCEGEET